MKTSQEWILQFNGKPTIEIESMDGVYLTPSEITTIQQEAFESGRVVGRKQEMLSMAKFLREEGLVKAAKSLELWAESLSEATPNPLKSPSL